MHTLVNAGVIPVHHVAVCTAAATAARRTAIFFIRMSDVTCSTAVLIID